MEEKLAEKIVSLAVKQGHIPPDKILVYRYGFELFISSLVSVWMVVIIATLFGRPELALVYLIGFIPIRVCAGGYHGKSHLECYLVFSISFTACLIFASDLNFTVTKLFSIITSSILMLTMVLLAPVEAKNKVLSPQRKKRNRKIAILWSLLDLFVSVVLFLTQIKIGIAGAIYYLSKWVVILFTVWPVACGMFRMLTRAER